MNLFRKKSEQAERRAQFRNKMPSFDFEALLRCEGGATLDMAIVDLASGGAQVRVNPQRAKSLREGDSVTMEIVLGHPGRLLQLPAQVRHIQGGLMNLEFLHTDFDRLDLDAESRMLLTRRKNLRQRFQEHVPVDLTIGNVVVTGKLVDLSIGGVGIKLETDLAGELSRDGVVQLDFLLPRSLSSCSIEAVVRHRTPRDGGVHFGVEFQPEFDDQLNPIRDYLSQARRS